MTAESEDVVRFTVWRDIFPPAHSGAYDAVQRVIRTPFVVDWQRRPEAARQDAERLRGEIMAAVRAGRGHELLPFTGQTAGLIHDLVPAAEIVRRLVAEAEQALQQAARLAM